MQSSGSRSESEQRANMPLPRQLELPFRSTGILPVVHPGVSPGDSAAESAGETALLQALARELLRIHGARPLANKIRVEWNPRLKTCAGRADCNQKLITLNPELNKHPDEIERTLLHELAHILAQFRAGRRRILPHGVEWQQACRDFGISDEKRCHNLPFPVSERARRYLYRCPGCRRNFPRVRPIKRAVACLACCRAHNGGEFDARFRLKLVNDS
jgi:SprT protein